MPEPDRSMAERLHAVIKESADKFKSRYATIGFNDVAYLDDGAMWSTSFALKG